MESRKLDHTIELIHGKKIMKVNTEAGILAKCTEKVKENSDTKLPDE
jgi:hypothetical protein